MIRYYTLFILLFFSLNIQSQSEFGFEIGRLKYSGGGDWYNDPSGEVNLLNFVSQNTDIIVNPKYVFIDLSNDDIFGYPFIFVTGHGNIVFSASDAQKLRLYLENGGFLYVDDDYGLDKSFRREIKKVFPEKVLQEIPFDFPLYHCLYNFEYGPPKIHEHDNKPPQGFGIFVDNRLAVYYTYESNPGDGWTDAGVHNTPQERRQKALEFGTNLIVYALSN